MTAELERTVRSAVTRVLSLARVPADPAHVNEAVAVIMTAANARALGYARECVAAIGKAAAGSATVPAGTVAAEAADELIASGAGPEPAAEPGEQEDTQSAAAEPKVRARRNAKAAGQ